jgi:hypothetical protein
MYILLFIIKQKKRKKKNQLKCVVKAVGKKRRDDG